MTCPTCKITLSKHDHWCSGCGKYFNGDANVGESSRVSAATTAANPTPPPVAPIPVLNTPPAPAPPWAQPAATTPPENVWTPPVAPPSDGWAAPTFTAPEKPRRNDRAVFGGGISATAVVFIVIRVISLCFRLSHSSGATNYGSDSDSRSPYAAPPAYTSSTTYVNPASPQIYVPQNPPAPVFPTRPIGNTGATMMPPAPYYPAQPAASRQPFFGNRRYGPPGSNLNAPYRYSQGPQVPTIGEPSMPGQQGFSPSQETTGQSVTSRLDSAANQGAASAQGATAGSPGTGQ